MEAYYIPEKSKSKSGFKNFVLVVGIILFIYLGGIVIHAIDGRKPGYIYIDSLIIGKTKEEIVAVYGEPDHRFRGNEFDYNINCFISAQCYHAIIFEDGVAVEIDRHRTGYP